MAVAFIEFGVSPGASSVSCVITKPTNLAIGNLMIAHIASASTTAISAPDVSWTQLQNIATTNGRGAAFYKQATSTDVAAASFTFTCGNADNKGAISTWSGHDTGTPIATSNGQANANVTNVTAPTITPIANCMIVLSGASISGARTFSGYAITTSNPATWAEAYDTASTAVSVGCGYALRPENTATGNGTIVKSGLSRNVGILLAIQPRGTTASTSSSSSSYSSNSSSSNSSSSRSSASSPSSNSSSSKSSLSSPSSASSPSSNSSSSNSSSSISSASSPSSNSSSSVSSASSPSSNSSSSVSSASSPSSNSSSSISSASSPSSNSSSSVS